MFPGQDSPNVSARVGWGRSSTLLQWINLDDEPKVAYLVLDATEGAPSAFTLDLVEVPLPPPTPYETCSEAAAAPGIRRCVLRGLRLLGRTISIPPRWAAPARP